MSNLKRFDDTRQKALNLRPAELKDVKLILDAQNSTFPHDPANLSFEEIIEAINDSQQDIFVAMFENEFVGYIALHNRKFRPWTNLNNLIILSNYKRKGFATQLLKLAKRKINRPLLRLFVEKKNKTAIHLYRKYGFMHTSTRANHYEDGDAAYVMVAPIWV